MSPDNTVWCAGSRHCKSGGDLYHAVGLWAAGRLCPEPGDSQL